ncbi:MAG: hypothetical protein DRJ05_10680, partial [Bacteroidetes bacterium]
MDNPNKIDNYFKEHLNDLEVETSQKLWGKLYWMLIYKKVLIWVLISGIAIATFFLIFNPMDDNFNLVLSNEPISNRTEIITEDATSTILPNKIKLRPSINQSNSEKANQINTKKTKTGKHTTETIKISPVEQKQNTKTIYQKNKDPQYIDKSTISLSILENLTTIQFKGFEDFDNSHKYLSTFRNLAGGVFGEGEENNIAKTKKNFWSGSVFLNANYVSTNLSGKVSYTDYLSNRNKSEESIITMGATAELKLSIGHFFMQSGIDWSAYGQDANYKSVTEEIDYETSFFNYDTTWVWIYDPPFEYPYPLTVDSTFVPDYIIETTSVKNRYTYLEIPFIVGVQFASDKKVNFEIGTGLSFGFLVSAKGQLPSLKENPLTEINKSSKFLKNTSINFIVQSGVRFRLNDKTGFV